MLKISALLAGALLFVAGTCFAEDQWPDQYSAGMGPDARKEFATLSENGRAAYKRALIACALYVDEPTNEQYKADCKATVEGFTLEFAHKTSAMSLIFRYAIISTEADQT